MRSRRLFAVLGIPILAMACATGSTDVVGSGDGGGGNNVADASYGADDASSGSDSGGSVPTDSGGGTKIDSGTTAGPPLVTDGGDCIGDPQAPLGYDFACDLGLVFGGPGVPCAAGMNQCDPGQCCFTDTSGMCYSDNPDASLQCVTVAM